MKRNNNPNEPEARPAASPPTVVVPPRRRRAARFTMIELVVAMGCFTLIMFALMSYLATAQKAWSQAASNSSVYDNAQFIFEIIGKDLQSAVASNRDGEKIPFLYTSTANFTVSSDYVAFVANVPTGDNARSNLSKIKYTKESQNGKEYLTRTQVSDYDASNAAVSGYANYFNPTNTTWATGITTSTAALVAGVDNFSMVCYADNAGTAFGTGSNSFQLPYAVNVSVTLYDETKSSTTPSAEKDQSRRTFNRLFFIGGGSDNNAMR